uniref:Prepilin-type N-terminal cleavage/methylation domain-containing protein n=1 Tax=Eiseniibacteriota bacterium TaxID=2212470 RepID=A0A832I302_UNCEI
MRTPVRGDQRGVTLVELMIALVVLALGVMAVGALFPTGTREASKDNAYTVAHYHAQEKLEELRGKTWTDPDLAPGRHPSTVEDLGSVWRRWYDVEAMSAPLDNLRKITVSVYWIGQSSDTVTATTYVRR